MKPWWKRPFRMLQYNLQVKDTAGMEARQIAEETAELGANVVVMNVGGIYAWYPTQVAYHHRNEYLPEGRDLLKEWIAEFHERDIRFVARFDFQMAQDDIYLQMPQWFVCLPDKSPRIVAEKRMGNWPLLITTCANAGYRNKSVAVPVLREVLENYDIDGIFLNAPAAQICYCERCRKKYFARYAREMPQSQEEIEPDWKHSCMKDNMDVLYRAVKDVRQDVPFLLYYFPFQWSAKEISFNRRDNIYDRYDTADMILTEAQNVLSAGACNLRETAYPLMAVKAGQREDNGLRPLGMVHSSPGMDWRHVGLPEAEFLPWMCQIPAFGGTLWVSLTGYGDTIGDRRILRAVRDVNHRIRKVERDMDGAVSSSEVCLFWDGSEAAQSWVDCLLQNHITFDFMQDYRVNESGLKRYKAAVLPETLLGDRKVMEIVRRYTESGGRVLTESRTAATIEAQAELLGVDGDVRVSEYLYASYMRIEDSAMAETMGTDKIVFRGEAAYVCPTQDSTVYTTLIPPFSPLNGAGAPPERASLAAEKTQLPMAVRRKYGKGEVIFLPFAFGRLLHEFRMPDHYRFAGILLEKLLERRQLRVDAVGTVYTSLYEKGNMRLIHLVNETGARPIRETVPVHDIRMTLRLPPDGPVRVETVIEGQRTECWRESEELHILLEKLEVWEMIKVTLAVPSGL